MCLATLLGEAPSLLLKSQMGVASRGVPRTQQGLAHSVCRNDDGPEALKVNDINHRQSPTPSTLVPMLPAPLCEPSCRGAPGRPQGASAVTPGGSRSAGLCPAWFPACRHVPGCQCAAPRLEACQGCLPWVRADNWAGALASPGEGLGSGCWGMGSLLSGPRVSSCGDPPAEGAGLSPSLFGQTLFQPLSQTPPGRIWPPSPTGIPVTAGSSPRESGGDSGDPDRGPPPRGR